MILPDLPALLNGTLEPRDNNERLAMLGVCLFANRFRDSARLYVDAFIADQNLMQDLDAAHRYNAARWAALAGCGQGANGASLGEPERTKWRTQARKWLRADLVSHGAAHDKDPARHRERAQRAMQRCRETPDLAGLREPSNLEKLPLDEASGLASHCGPR